VGKDEKRLRTLKQEGGLTMGFESERAQTSLRNGKKVKTKGHRNRLGRNGRADEEGLDGVCEIEKEGPQGGR